MQLQGRFQELVVVIVVVFFFTLFVNFDLAGSVQRVILLFPMLQIKLKNLLKGDLILLSFFLFRL